MPGRSDVGGLHNEDCCSICVNNGGLSPTVISRANLGTPPRIKRRGDYDYPRVKLTNRTSIKRQLLGPGKEKDTSTSILFFFSILLDGCHGYRGRRPFSGSAPSECDWSRGGA
ncbi:hypothetical protein JTE90_002037 [Oedothorax gibbosus]|uniref:Uncharacterized protein n=1 Tax=Oedothorax gibbosus TaxID=931172 RepID=A0AAV6UN14_9ARAC|nr:hypothetical protein JTE90_002037 [Oedothorax gibbosus]